MIPRSTTVMRIGMMINGDDSETLWLKPLWSESGWKKWLSLKWSWTSLLNFFQSVDSICFLSSSNILSSFIRLVKVVWKILDEIFVDFFKHFSETTFLDNGSIVKSVPGREKKNDREDERGRNQHNYLMKDMSNKIWFITVNTGTVPNFDEIFSCLTLCFPPFL